METDSFTGNASKEALSAESAQKVLIFTCPECGGHHLEHWIADFWLAMQIKAVTEDGHISWDYYTEEVGGNGEIIYSCRDCDFQIPYGEVQDCDLEEDDDEDCVIVWMHQNCEYIDRPEDEEQDVDESHQVRFLKFTCPRCGTHEFRVVRNHCSEVTPVEYASDEDELSYGRMKYVEGERAFYCLGCDYRFEIDESLEEGKALAKWLIENCNQA